MARRKSKTPAEQRATDLAAVGLSPDAAFLIQQSTIEVTRAGQQRAKATDDKKAAHDTARRLDAFEALKAGMVAGAYDAARRLERDILTRLGLSDRPPASGRVDCERAADDYARLAGIRVDEVLGRIPPRDHWLLQELIAPPIDRGTWRAHVAYITGERHTEGQAAAVRAACVNLRDAYAAIERRAAA